MQNTYLTLIIIYNLLCLVAVVLLYYHSGTDLQFRNSDSNVLLVVRYVPTLTGTITTVVGRIVVMTFERLETYIAMADSKDCTQESKGLRSICNRILIPLNPFWLRYSQNYRGLLLWVHLQFLSFITVSKAIFLTISDIEAGHIQVASDIAQVLISLYTMHLVTLIYILWYLWGRPTGLKWDPVQEW